MSDIATLEVIKLSPQIGAEIRGINLAELFDQEMAAELNRLWLEHLVLLFRGQKLSQEDQLRVTAAFGKIGPRGRPKEFNPKGYDDILDNIMLITNIREDGEPIGALPDGDMMFHHDMLHADIPHKGTILYAIEVPSAGGNTLFANGYAAYESLPEDIRGPLDDRKAFHHYHYGSTQKGDDLGTPAFSESVHPVFRTHEDTGKKAVYINRLMTEGVVDMADDQSAPLLNAVFDHSEKPEFVYEHVWKAGDLLLWDNRCSMHGRTDFSTDEIRLMHRTTIQGEHVPY
ncbi:MAG: TauD/TfdA family dioxygenase [Rhodospirillales bacterium]|nr:TauD/TfdA family dioxygenase [Rhodospirillales bacterium]